MEFFVFFFFSSRRRHTRSLCDWSSDVCSSDLATALPGDVLGVWAGHRSPLQPDPRQAGLLPRLLPVAQVSRPAVQLLLETSFNAAAVGIGPLPTSVTRQGSATDVVGPLLCPLVAHRAPRTKFERYFDGTRWNGQQTSRVFTTRSDQFSAPTWLDFAMIWNAPRSRSEDKDRQADQLDQPERPAETASAVGALVRAGELVDLRRHLPANRD